MYVDSIVDEVHQIRHAILAEYGGDMKAYNFEASCITVGLFDTDSGVKRCEHGAQSAECLQRAA